VASASEKLLPEAAAALALARRSANDLAKSIWGSDFERRVALVRERYAGRGGDPFGLDPDTAERAVKICALFHRLYFRTTVHGVEHLPEGRVLLVANHSGQIPIDAAIIAAAGFLDADPPRVIRAMVEKWASTLPFVSTFLTRLGHVVGVPENGRRLLEMGEAVLVFPEGIRGVSKPFTHRYRLAEFGRGFMRLGMATETPIVPVALIGAEEQYISLGNLDWAARLLNMPVFPIVPQVLLPGGQLPLPTKYHLTFGEPLHFAGDPDDDALVAERVRLVETTISGMLAEGLRERRGVFL
jgi:1-acyl-sn-glycerol-3-phosphate acyltransferase